MKEKKRSCVDCAVMNCDKLDKEYPEFCLTTEFSDSEIQNALKEYEDENVRSFMIAAAEVEYEGYCKITRVEETILFAKKIGAKKLGIATCVGLIREAGILTKILRSHGFEVYGIACKAGTVEKTAVGIDPVCMQIGRSMCNPILQAQTLKRENTDLNIVLGLCIGHDALFYRHSDAPVTTLVVKDRILGHNPAAALYTSHSYYNKLY